MEKNSVCKTKGVLNLNKIVSVWVSALAVDSKDKMIMYIKSMAGNKNNVSFREK